MDREEVLALLRERIGKEGGIGSWARRHAVSDQYIRDVLSEKRPPGPSILSALGLRKDTVVRDEEAPCG